MGLLSGLASLFTSGASDVVKSVSTLYTTDAQRIEGEAKIRAIFAGMEEKVQESISKRHVTDMQSDSWLSKNIRPIALIHFVIVWDVCVLLAYFGFVVPAALLLMVEGAVQLILGFYFGGRTVEKMAKMVSSAWKK